MKEARQKYAIAPLFGSSGKGGGQATPSQSIFIFSQAVKAMYLPAQKQQIQARFSKIPDRSIRQKPNDPA